MSLAANQQIIFDMISAAAHNGDECPSNGFLASAIDASSAATACYIVNRLEGMGLIKVQRGGHSRVVTIVETGKSTAGSVGKPHWRFRSENSHRRHIRYEGQVPHVPRTKRADGRTTKEARQDMLAMPRVDRDPCPRCGVRGDIGCAHRAASLAVSA